METRGAILLIALLLTLLAAVPRFYGLGSMGFYGDEETTSLPSRALAEGKGVLMPSGMAYRRALPQTLLNAASAKVFGVDKEFSYRFPAAVLGTLTIPLLFLGARPLVGGAAALVGALMLAFSEWHIVISREARMYAPFLFFYVAAAFSVWRWAATGAGRYLVIAAATYAAAVSFQPLGIIVVIFALLPLALQGNFRVHPVRLAIFALVAGAGGLLYTKYFVDASYKSWKVLNNLQVDSNANISETSATGIAKIVAGLSPGMVFFALAGIALGFWAARICCLEDGYPRLRIRKIFRYISACLTGLLACTGNLYGAALAAMTFLVILPEGRYSLNKKIVFPLALTGLAVGVQVVLRAAHSGLVKGIKSMLMFPFPYPFSWARMFPGVVLLFAVTALVVALRRNGREDTFLQAAILAVVLPVAAIGTVKAWGGVRYLIEAYPFLLLSAGVGMCAVFSSLKKFGRWGGRFALFIPIGVAASGLLGGHGMSDALQAATIRYGESLPSLKFPFYPDHQAPGRFVRKNMAPGDIVVAEDALEQCWYIGRVDYWLRNPENHRTYFYQGPDGRLRDIYVSSLAVTSEVLKSLKNTENNRIWLITSGETAHFLDFYLNDEQRKWLAEVEEKIQPIFNGRDGVTKVYCLQ